MELTVTKRSLPYGITLMIASFMGLIAAFVLTLEKIHSLTNPDEGASCDFSVVVQCTTNLGSAQGAIFGFPNPLLGLMAWPFVLVTAVLVLANVKLPKFYWALFLLGTLGGIALVVWLIGQSIFVLGTLCIWCMVTWAAMIPTFVATLTHAGAQGVFGQKLRIFSTKAKGYVFVVTILAYFSIALMAQLRLDWLATL